MTVKQTHSPEAAVARAAVLRLIEDSPPVLVEVRFPGMGTSPDWHLLEDEVGFDRLWEKLGPGVELHVSSVWDLKNFRGAARLTR
jgi:hypothetical protein